MGGYSFLCSYGDGVFILFVGKVLVDGPTAHMEFWENLYRTYRLNCHGAKGLDDGLVADSHDAMACRPQPEDSPEKTRERIIKDYSRWKAGDYHTLLEVRVIRGVQTECPSLSKKEIPMG